MNIIETKPIGSALFHDFSADYHGDTFYSQGRNIKRDRLPTMF